MWVNNRNKEVEKEETIERWWRWWCRENSRNEVAKQRGKINQGDVRRREG